MGKTKMKKVPKHRKTEIVFDASKRADFLTGFRKRKDERRKKAKEQAENELREEKRIAREKAKEEARKGIDSASNRVVPEIEHLLEHNTRSTDTHDLGSHTVEVMHLDLRKKDPSSAKEEEESSTKSDQPEIAGDDSANPMAASASSKKALKKAMSKSMSALNKKHAQMMSGKAKTISKQGRLKAKFQRKSMKSKRTRHHNPKKITG